jgi:hypothetical protein
MRRGDQDVAESNTAEARRRLRTGFSTQPLQVARSHRYVRDMTDLNALSGLETSVKAAEGGPETWNPPFCGDLDMRIASDGTWYYFGSPIGRTALVKLFSSVLRKEGEQHFLVTPVEKVGIRVDDAPFTAVEMQVDGEGIDRKLRFRTNVDEWIEAGPLNRLRFGRDERGAVKPYLHVRSGLEALVARPVFYDLVELGEERETAAGPQFGVMSGGTFFAMAPAAEVSPLI